MILIQQHYTTLIDSTHAHMPYMGCVD